MNSGLQVYNEQNRLSEWAQLVSQCRGSGMTVRQWCEEHGISLSSFYKWQRKVYAATQVQQEAHFVEVTPVQQASVTVSDAAVTIRVAGAEADIHSGAEADIHSGADAATVEMVLWVLKSC